MEREAINIKELISMGESYTLQFKREFIGQDRIADEMVAFANSKGGIIIIGLEVSKFGLKIETIANTCGLDPNLYGLKMIECGLEASKCGLGNQECGLGLNETLILALMHEESAIKLKEISQALNISSRYVDKLVAGLKSKGLLRKVGGKRFGKWQPLI